MNWKPIGMSTVIVARPKHMHNYAIQQDGEQFVWSAVNPSFGAKGYASSIEEAKRICDALESVDGGA